MYEEIDRRAMAAPAAATGSIPSLAAYLTGGGKTDREKARALYCWVAQHIEYDVAEFRSGAIRAPPVEEILRTRKAVCNGYARLLEALARSAGMNAVTINGHAKGFGFTVGDPKPVEPNHAWNAMQIDGQWALLDSTWGAGSIDGMNFVRRFDEHFFLTPPAQFIYTHLPVEPRWQLLSVPLSTEEYLGLAQLCAAFFRNNLRLVDQPHPSITTDFGGVVTVEAQQEVQMTSGLFLGQQELDARWVLTQKEGHRFVTHFVCPHPGRYLLRLYVKRTADPGSYRSAVEYAIWSHLPAPSDAGFMRTYPLSTGAGVCVHSPTRRSLSSRTTIRFDIEAPGANDVVVINNDNWIHLIQTGRRFLSDLKLNPGKVRLCVRYSPTGTNYEVAAEYEIL